MEKYIMDYLAEKEMKKNIKVIYGVKHNPSLLYRHNDRENLTVYYIYYHHPDWYLQLDNLPDQIDEYTQNILFRGFDLRMVLQRIYSSDMEIIDTLLSGTVFINQSFIDEILPIMSSYFLPQKALRYYLDKIAQIWGKYLQNDSISVSDYFFAFANVLSSKWIIQNRTIPPASINNLINTLDEPECDALNVILHNYKYSDKLNRNEQYNSIIYTSYIEGNQKCSGIFRLPKKTWSDLNHYFIDAIKKEDRHMFAK